MPRCTHTYPETRTRLNPQEVRDPVRSVFVGDLGSCTLSSWQLERCATETVSQCVICAHDELRKTIIAVVSRFITPRGNSYTHLAMFSPHTQKTWVCFHSAAIIQQPNWLWQLSQLNSIQPRPECLSMSLIRSNQPEWYLSIHLIPLFPHAPTLSPSHRLPSALPSIAFWRRPLSSANFSTSKIIMIDAGASPFLQSFFK